MASRTNGAKAAPTIVVIGAGIIGLASAIRLQELLAQTNATTRVLLVAREWPGSFPGSPSQHSANYASMWAGAHVRPIPATTEQLRTEAAWLKESAAEFEKQRQAEPWCGITRTLGVEYLEAPDEGYAKQTKDSFTQATGLQGYREYSSSELPAEVRLGFEYQTYCINAPLYCQSLLRKFILQGGKTLQRGLASEWEAFQLGENVQIVINASGTGFSDSKCFPIRGQTVLTNMSSATRTVTRQNKDGSWNFIIPRFFSGGTVVGGTKQPGNWSVEPDMDTRKMLLAAGRKLRPYAEEPQNQSQNSTDGEIGVITDVVGRRPAREGGMRIELDTNTAGPHKGKLIHAYGAGGRGYEISWGAANQVAKLAAPFILGHSGSKL